MGTNKTVEGVRHLQFLAEMRKMWEHERAWMEAELRTGEAEVKELQIELSLSRRTRGLINALGSGFKWLFGTATEEDTKRLHKDMKGLEIQTGKLHHPAELHATLIGTISKNQKRNTRNLAALAKKAMDLERSLAVTRAADHLTMTNIRRELDFINLRPAGGGCLNTPCGFSQIARKRRRALPPGFHLPYPHLFGNFCESFDPGSCKVRSPGQVK